MNINKGNGNAKVYVVEDSLIVSLELQDKLRDMGFTVVGSSDSGEEAVQNILTINPDIVLMDIMLAGELDGIQASRLVKDHLDIPIIFTTAYSDDDTINRVKESNSDGFVLKPYDYKELFTTIDLLLKKNESQKLIKINETKYRVLFEESRDPIYLIDKNRSFIDINHSFTRLFGYTKSETRSMKLMDLFIDEDKMPAIFEKLSSNGSVYDHEVSLKTKNNTELNCLISISQVDSVVYSMEGYQGIIQDITRQKKAENEIIESMQKIEKAISGIINVVALTLEVRDPHTAGHQKRVSLVAQTIAETMNCPEDVIRGISLAGKIHDIGKIAIPAEILSKPSKLSAAEFALIKTHPAIGYQIIKEIEFPWPLADIVHQHHERFDGSGYPEGLQGDEILMESRIIAVADVVEAMASHRPYRPAIGFGSAIEEIKNKSGSYFDPQVVEALDKAVTEGKINEEFLISQ